MKSDVVPVRIRGIVPANGGIAIFIGNTDKVFIIQVEGGMGRVISNYLGKVANERPLTHDLMGSIFKGFGIQLERVVISDLRNSTYFARLILKEENELGVKLLEVDARPSDCIALAVAHGRPIYVAGPLFEQVEDMSALLEQFNQARQQDPSEGEDE
ncbi:MAG: bifunctional nuclease family protein [Verrucomicrobiales bacterium]|nr:bifunctional nuclease family protein [Verrucomicrobiales bacterium]